MFKKKWLNHRIHLPLLLTCIKSKFGQDIISPTKQLDRWAEYYKDLDSDPSITALMVTSGSML